MSKLPSLWSMLTTITPTTSATTTAYCVHNSTFLYACQKLAKLAHMKHLVFVHMTERLTVNCLSHGMTMCTVLTVFAVDSKVCWFQ